MRIVFIIDQVYLHGGIERVLSIKANYFASKPNYEVFIITSEQKDNPFCYEFDKKITFHDLKINYNRKKSYFHPTNLKKLPKHIKRTKSIIKKINPNVVVVCSHSADTYFVPFINKKIPKAKEFHYSKFIEIEKRKNPRSLFKKYFLKFADYVEGKYDRLIVLNPNEVEYYRTNNTIIIPNPLTFYPENVSDVSSKVVISAGRIAPVKGYDILIDIWNKVSPKYPEWELHIYGDGEPVYIDELKKKVKDNNLQDTLIFQGSTDDIQNKMLHSSMYVMTSHNECFPLVLLEAQACGLPIVSFDCPHGPGNIINTDNGILIPHYNNEVFADQLIKLMGDNKKRKELGENARKNSYNYKIDNIMGRWKKMFEELSK
ncbi:glycosyltransferase family 4 protein [Aquimarina gracilis]|uniref:Glycosyltransferase family 4 protein n=1 Tax=Aquimarina gracilis TaxID=874422 RepID=A0ABU6A1Y3_9FLAO|nr:glycosyltransferase family 4 protein [Aquimarina gracilis]MEB3348189.1 glycosyltransferase family 4 protein [Aquimarina gracilis]